MHSLFARRLYLRGACLLPKAGDLTLELRNCNLQGGAILAMACRLADSAPFRQSCEPTSVGVHDGQDARLSPRRQLVVNEVHGPDLIGHCCYRPVVAELGALRERSYGIA